MQYKLRCRRSAANDRICLKPWGDAPGCILSSLRDYENAQLQDFGVGLVIVVTTAIFVLQRELSMTNRMNNVLSLLPLLLMAAASIAAEPPKNIVLILADDLGWADTTLYGKTSLYETPNIERLAARGLTFSSAYASPICSPTRASIVTGQNPARLGMTAPAAHLEAERFEASASENGPPHQKCTNVRSATR
jgi:hypothetical protein